MVGFDVTIVDPRPEMASALDFTGATLLVRDVAPALHEARLDARSAVVMLAHSPEIDDPAIVGGLDPEYQGVGSGVTGWRCVA